MYPEPGQLDGSGCRGRRAWHEARRPSRVYAVTMAETPAGSLGERIGAACVIILAIGLLFIGADILAGGRLAGRKGGCGCDDAGS